MTGIVQLVYKPQVKRSGQMVGTAIRIVCFPLLLYPPSVMHRMDTRQGMEKWRGQERGWKIVEMRFLFCHTLPSIADKGKCTFINTTHSWGAATDDSDSKVVS